MVQNYANLSNELNKTQDSNHAVEDFHAAESYGFMEQIGLLTRDRVAKILETGRLYDRRSRLMEALNMISYARIAGREGNYLFALDLLEEVLKKMRMLKRNDKQESAQSYFYFEYSQVLQALGDAHGSMLYLERARQHAQSNKLKQVIAYETMAREIHVPDETTRRKWRQSIAYFNKYDMKVMGIEAHFDLAQIFMADQEISEAANHLDLAHELAVTAGYHYQHLKIEYARGKLLETQERLPEALAFYEDKLASIDNSYYRILYLLKIATLSRQLQQPERAFEAARESLELAQRFSVLSAQAEAGILVAEIYREEQRDMTKAFFYYQQGAMTALSATERGIPLQGMRKQIVSRYIGFLEEHFPGKADESANEDLFAFSKGLTWVRIKDLFHYNLFLYHYLNTGIGNATLKVLDIPPSSFYSATERLRKRGIPFPNFRKREVEIPSENYVEGLQQYVRMHRDKNWLDINEQFEKDMLAYHYKLNNYNKRLMSESLHLAYSGIVGRTRYLTRGDQ